jgi:hypothetical protein
VEHGVSFTLRDVVAMGFEASCVALDGTRYFWRRTFGVRVDTRRGETTLLTDPASLPDIAWFPTSLGRKQLEAAERAGRLKLSASPSPPRGSASHPILAGRRPADGGAAADGRGDSGALKLD